MMKISTQKKTLKETMLASIPKLDVSLLSIIADKVSVYVLFSDKVSSYISLNAPPEFSTQSIHTKINMEDNRLNIEIWTDLKNIADATIYIYLTNEFDSITIRTISGDIGIEGCTANSVYLNTDSGDICVEKHINPCTFQTNCKNGDLVKQTQYHKSKINHCVCKTKNGDIIIS